MHQSTWHSEDGQLLRRLREQAGIDEHTFARANTLSLSQLRELEEGGHSSFYNPAIKRSTGVKLLKKFGHELPPSPQSSPAPSALQAPHSTPLLPPSAASSTPDKRPRAFAAAQTAIQPRLVVWWIGLVLLTALLWLLLKTWTTQPTVVLPTPMALSAPTPAPTEPPASTTITDPQSFEETSPAEVALALSCEWQHRANSQIHTPSQPLKPGNYVYLEALADIELCVIDSQNQQVQLQLKAGAVKSVYGTAPFLVQSQNWQSMKLFFQGRRVQTSLQNMQHLLLNSRPF